MSGNRTQYLLDANVFIEAKNRYYAFQICPGFWQALVINHAAKRVISIDSVYDELIAQKDELSKWVTDHCPASFFKKTQDTAVIDQYQELVRWVYAQGFVDEANSEFADVADGWVIAYARANGLTVVTHEEFAPHAQKAFPFRMSAWSLTCHM